MELMFAAVFPPVADDVADDFVQRQVDPIFRLGGDGIPPAPGRHCLRHPFQFAEIDSSAPGTTGFPSPLRGQFDGLKQPAAQRAASAPSLCLGFFPTMTRSARELYAVATCSIMPADEERHP